MHMYVKKVKEACICTTKLIAIILMRFVVASLTTSICTEGIEEGWYECITCQVFALLIVIVVTTRREYKQRDKQGLQFQNKENNLQVLRIGRRGTVSVNSDLVEACSRSLPPDELPTTGDSEVLDNLVALALSLPLRKLKLVRAIMGRRDAVVDHAVAGTKTYEINININWLRRAVAVMSGNFIKLGMMAFLLHYNGAEAAGVNPTAHHNGILTKPVWTTETLAFVIATSMTIIFGIIVLVHWICANVDHIARIRNLAASLRAKFPVAGNAVTRIADAGDAIPPIVPAPGVLAGGLNPDFDINRGLASTFSTITRERVQEILPPLRV